MKKIFFVVISILITVIAFGQVEQHARLNAYGMYSFQDKFDSYYDSYNYYNGQINAAFQGGLGIEYMAMPHTCVELMWLHQSTNAPTTYQEGVGNGVKTTNFSLNMDYLLIGSDAHVQNASGKVEGYGGLFLGMAFVGAKNPDNANHYTATKFAWGTRLGCNIWATETFGIKLQAQFLSIAQGAGGGLYFGTGGAGVGVSTYSSVYQFQVGGGITFKLGQHHK